MENVKDTLSRIEKELAELGHVARNGTVKLEGIMCLMEAVLKDMRSAIETAKAEIESIIQEDI